MAEFTAICDDPSFYFFRGFGVVSRSNVYELWLFGLFVDRSEGLLAWRALKNE